MIYIHIHTPTSAIERDNRGCMFARASGLCILNMDEFLKEKLLSLLLPLHRLSLPSILDGDHFASLLLGSLSPKSL